MTSRRRAGDELPEQATSWRQTSTEHTTTRLSARTHPLPPNPRLPGPVHEGSPFHISHSPPPHHGPLAAWAVWIPWCHSRPGAARLARARLCGLDNTVGGQVVDAGYVADVTARSLARGIATHLGGARLFNAAVASRCSVRELTRGFDSVSVCFSKGLGAPVGSALCGSRSFIERAHRWRKMSGGGLRQAGILAAAALHALDHHVQRLATDHDHASRLAAGLMGLAGVSVQAPQTNIVFLDLSPEVLARHPQGVAAALADHGLLCTGSARLRLVTHLDIQPPQVEQALHILRAVLS